jgi:Uma2 family endonuclease
MNVLPLEQEIEYPTSDGQPMAEDPEHLQVMIDSISGLASRYAAAPDVWVGGNFFLYYERGNRKARVSPDVMVAMGVVPRQRRRYLLWEEKPPSLIIEVTSLESRRKDLEFKKPLYERLGAKEYVLFDPLGEYLRPSLQGFRLLRGRYHSIPLEPAGSLVSRTTGLRFQREGVRLRLVDVRTGERILWREELEAKIAEDAAARRAAQAKAAEEVAARQAAEIRAVEEAVARQAAEAARQAAEARAAEMEERLRNLERELRQLRQS